MVTNPFGHHRCKCGSDHISVCVTTLVFVYMEDGQVTHTVVPAPIERQGVARCLSCERLWIVNHEPVGSEQ